MVDVRARFTYHVVFAAVALDNYSAIFIKTRAWDDDLKSSVLGIGEGNDDEMNRYE